MHLSAHDRRRRDCSKRPSSPVLRPLEGKAASREESEAYTEGTLSPPSNENAAGGIFQQPLSRVATRTPRSGCMRPKGSAEKLEARRRLAANLLTKGRGIREVARTIGAAPSSVKRWKDALKEGGKNALKSKPHTGRPSRLSPTQRQHLLQILQKGPRAANLRADQWTCSRIGIVIRRSFGVKYHPDHVSRILRALGWKYQRKRSLVKKQGRTEQSRLRWANLARRHR